MQRILEEMWTAVVTVAERMPQEFFWAAGGLFFAILVLMVLMKRARNRKPRQPLPTDQIQADGVPKQLSVPEPDTFVDVIRPEIEAAKEVPGTLKEKEPEPVDKAGFLGRLKSGLSKTRSTISGGLDKIFSGSRKLDQEALEEVEELLITADVGVQATMSLIRKVSGRATEIQTLGDLKAVLKDEIIATIQAVSRPAAAQTQKTKPKVIMVIGVNGVGKTTTIGKLAARFAEEGKRVLIVAADTFRAAAIEQLTIWAERAGAEIVKHKQNSDPAAVAYDGVEAAVARGMDIVLIDTAGRLHTKVNLMEELKKIKRTIAKKIPDAPHEILMVLDATTGQNALIQAKMFHEALDVTGIVLTKLDGTAKGGIVIAIGSATNIPLDYIGVGEQTADLQDFDPEQFVNALFEEV